MSSKFKGQKVNWMAIYDFLYVFHTNFDHNMHHLWDTVSWKFHDLELTLMSSKVKRHYVNWKAIYDFLYVFHIHFCHNMHNLWDASHLKLNDLDLTFQYNPRSKVMRSTERQHMTSYICFIQTLIIRCTVYEMQSQIQTHWFDAIRRF